MSIISMQQALYEALYEHHTAFQWVHFTPHGVVAGDVMRGYAGLELTDIYIQKQRRQAHG